MGVGAVTEPTQPLFATMMAYPADTVLMLLHGVHTYADVPWWISIASLTLCLRTALLPLNIEAMRISVRMARAAPELGEVQQRLQVAVGAKASEEQMRAIQAELMAIYARHNVSPASSLKLPLVQLPCFLSAMWGLQKAGAVFPSMATGGPPGFADLTVADPTYVLPLACSISMFATVQAAMSNMPPSPDPTAAKTQRLMGTVMRALAIASFPLTANLPAGLVMYWVVNNVLTFAQTSLLRMTAVRSALNIPPMPSPSELAHSTATSATEGGGYGGSKSLQAARLEEVGAALAREGKHEASLAILRQALGVAEGFSAMDKGMSAAGAAAGTLADRLAPPPSAEARTHVVSLRVQLASQLLRLERHAEAEAECEVALADAEQLADRAPVPAGEPSAAAKRGDAELGLGAMRVRALVALGDAREAQGPDRAVDAADAFQRAIDVATADPAIGLNHERVIHAAVRHAQLAAGLSQGPRAG